MSRNRRRPNPKANSKGKGNTSMTDEEQDSLKQYKGKGKPKSSNDPAWYAADETILRDAASYPFSYNTGATEIHDKSVWNITPVTNSPADQIPGICSLHVYPTVGTALASTDPINVAAQSVYSFVRHANSGHSNYDAPDLMLYILAMANMYSFLVWCERLYGYALTYDQRNRYIPNDLIRTNNVDPADLVNNLANFRFWVNTLISKMASFAVPATMSIFSRMSFMYSQCYIEGTSIKEQIYQYVPEGFYKFGIDSASKGNLTWEAFDYTTLMTTQDVITYGEALFNAIWSQEDFGIMSGDILKAYGDKIIKIAELPEYFKIVPAFDPMVLTQMKNADLVRVDPSRISQSTTEACILQTLTPLGISTADVFYGTTSNIGNTLATALNNCMVAALKDYRILTVDTDYPTPGVVIDVTRLKVGYDPVKSWYKTGTEVILSVTLTTSPGNDIKVPPYFLTYYDLVGDPATMRPTLLAEEAIRNFHYMPRTWFFVNFTGNKVDVYQSFDIDNFTVLTYEDVRKLHEAATINMFAVPSIGKVQ